ncbi:hypothetical protein AVEN_27738-1 [Araneus ventricosus]|uniref:MARF1 RNA recognition motif 1 domain-containing protein n=1 Tax=Araneus ventricosus TaxID=182803 RepID=A0A4Y2TQ25_ARAVE|nr:hypothetical protein AVEN_27738-1 [Araneus ventricosus]
MNNKPVDLLVSNLPVQRKASAVTLHLKRLAANTGGKVVSINGTKAVIRFSDYDSAVKAKTRMHKEPVCKKKISVDFVKGAAKS